MIWDRGRGDGILFWHAFIEEGATSRGRDGSLGVHVGACGATNKTIIFALFLNYCSLHILWQIACTCTVLVLYLYCTCTVLVLYLYCTCTVLVLYLYCTCTVLVLYLYCTCTVLVLYLYCTCTVLVLYLYCTCTVLV